MGEKLGSDVIMANAWHHRSDALSSVVAIVGVGGALMGWRVLDPLRGVAVAGLGAWMGGQARCAWTPPCPAGPTSARPLSPVTSPDLPSARSCATLCSA